MVCTVSNVSARPTAHWIAAYEENRDDQWKSMFLDRFQVALFSSTRKKALAMMTPLKRVQGH